MKNDRVLYEKRGRRYVPVAAEWCHADRMPVGTFRLTYCYGDGAYRYAYDVTPDTAGFAAAAQIAAVAMEREIASAAVATPCVPQPYTERQQAIIERFRKEMVEAGGLLPSWWRHASAHEIAQAGIRAVRGSA